MNPERGPRRFPVWCAICTALVLSAPGCVGPPHLTNVEEDGTSMFCTFYHYRYPGEDRGTLMSTDSGRTWNRLRLGEGDQEVEFVCRCRAGLLTELGNRQCYTSSDQGRTWSETATLRPGEYRMSGPTGRGESQVTFLGTGNGVWRSEDGGRTWEAADTTGMGNACIFSIAGEGSEVVLDVWPQKRGVFGDWTATGGFSGFRSEDRGGTCRACPLPHTGSIVAVSGVFLLSHSP